MLLPKDFETLVRVGGLAEKWDAFTAALDEPSPVSVHVNDRMSAYDIFRGQNLEPTQYCGNGFYLPLRPSFTLDPLLHAGCYYVQEASSMSLIVPLMSYVRPDSVVLDVCAAPGGKSIMLSQYLKDGGFLVANEPMPKRANVLAENLQKWGNDNFMVTHAFTDKLRKIDYAFDAVLVDAPCSGEGMFRKEPEALAGWSMDNVEHCAARQKEIVSDVWHLLKDNGIMIYSTCTYNHFEDEDIVAWIRGELGGTVLSQKHFYPHEHRGEGLFMAVIVKSREPEAAGQECIDVQCSENKPRSYSMRRAGERVIAVQKCFEPVVNAVQRAVPVLVSGTEVAVSKGRKYQPCHALALSKFRDDIIACCDTECKFEYRKFNLSEETALKYLRGEALFDCGGTAGWTLLTYRHQAIGWGNNVGNRINNLYPQQWRIKHY